MRWDACSKLPVSLPSAAEATTNYEALFARFCRLSYFDQHAVTSACGGAVVELVSAFAAGSSSYLPLTENVAFLFDMMERAYNVSGLLDFIAQVSSAAPPPLPVSSLVVLLG